MIAAMVLLMVPARQGRGRQVVPADGVVRRGRRDDMAAGAMATSAETTSRCQFNGVMPGVGAP
jgi:hypothetical protein